MFTTNKKISVLHPFINKKWWAVNMMIYLSDFLSKNNNNVSFYTFSYDKQIFPLDLKVVYFKNSRLVSFVKIAYSIRNSDFIFIWNSPMHFVWVISKIFFGSKAKLIWWQHHYPWYYSWKTNVFILFKRFLEKTIIKNIDSVIVNSKYLQDSIKDIYKIDSKILYPVLDNKFLNYNRVSSHLNNNTTSHLNSLPLSGERGYKGEGSSSKVIFSYWRWSEWKNLDLVFNTYDNLKGKSRELVLMIWWVWPELDFYKQKYEDDKNVKFLWLIDKNQIIENLEKSSLLLFPSKIDSFWLVILESMSIWVPVISFNIAWAKEIITNWINWYLVNSDSEFIDKTYEILINSSHRNNLSIEAIKTAKTFSEENFKNSLTEIFNTMK